MLIESRPWLRGTAMSVSDRTLDALIDHEIRTCRRFSRDWPIDRSPKLSVASLSHLTVLLQCYSSLLLYSGQINDDDDDDDDITKSMHRQFHLMDIVNLPFFTGAADAFADALLGRPWSLPPWSTTSRRSFLSFLGDPSLLRVAPCLTCPSSLRRKLDVSSFLSFSDV